MPTKLLIGFCIVSNTAFALIADEYSSNELIDKYEESLSVLDKSTFEIYSKVSVEGAQTNKIPLFLNRKTTVYRDGQRWDIMAADKFSFEQNSEPITAQYTGRLLDKRNIYFHSENDDVVDRVHVDTNFKYGLSKTLAALGGGIVAEGYLPGDSIRLPEILRNSLELSVHKNKYQIDGHSTYALESVGKHGKHIIWLDPDAGFHPRRIEVHKYGHDLLEGKSVLSSRLSTASPILYPDKPLNKYTLVVESIAIEEIDGIFVMTHADVSEAWTFSNGQIVQRNIDFFREKLDLNPDFEKLGAFKIRVPDGTRVIDHDFESASLEVYNGKMVARVDFSTLDVIDEVIQQNISGRDKVPPRPPFKCKYQIEPVDTSISTAPAIVPKATITQTSNKKSQASFWISLIATGLLIISGSWLILRKRKGGGQDVQG